MIQKCDCGKTGCDRYVILPHTQSYTKTQLEELAEGICEFLERLDNSGRKITESNE